MFRRVAERHWTERYAKLLVAMSVPEALGVLGFPPNANPTPQEITRAYRTKAFENHPDRGGDPSKMVEINVAKDVLERKPAWTPYSPPPRREPPRRKVEPDIVEEGQDFQKAVSGMPHAEWKFVSVPEWAWNSQNTSRPGNRIWAFYGFTNTKHVFAAIKNRGEGTFWRGDKLVKQEQDWQASWLEYPIKTSLTKIAAKSLKTVATEWADMSKTPKAPRKYHLCPGGSLSEKTFRRVPHSGGVALKDILVGAGLISDQDKHVQGRKTSVQMRFEYSSDKVKRRREKNQGRINRADQYEFDVIVNGRKARLHDDTVEKLERIFIPFVLGWDNVKEGVTRDLTKLRRGRFKGGAAEALQLLADSMTREPSWLIIALEKAAEEWEDTKKATLRRIRAEMTLFQAADRLGMSPYALFMELVG
jgi:hypothetical protein